MSSSSSEISACLEEKSAGGTDLTGISLFKSMVRRVRQKISESKLAKSPSDGEISDVLSKFENVSMGETSPKSRALRSPPPMKEAVKRMFATSRTTSDEKIRCDYNSDSGMDRKDRDSRIRIRQKTRSRSKSDSRRIEKKPKKILRTPPTYVYVRGLSGIPTQRIRVR